MQTMRVVKEAAERKDEILNVAEQLFVANGFDNTSTNDILQEIGIARGTLYYHFKSKEEILDSIIERMTKQLVEKSKEIVIQKNRPALQRLIIMTVTLNISHDHLAHEILEQAHKPQNALMHQKMQKSVLSGITPLVVSLIEECTKQGICQTDYPEEVAEMALLYYNTIFDDFMGHNEDIKQGKLIAFLYNLERLLRMEHGTLQNAITDYKTRLRK